MHGMSVRPQRRSVALFLLASVTASLVTAQTFGQSCAGCHALASAGKAPLVGEPFWKSFAQKTVGDLLEFVSANMPNGNPRSLSESTYGDIVALMLKSNGFPAGTTDLRRDTIANVQIVQKDGRT